MTQADLVQRAKQGDAAAIAALLNRVLGQHGITAVSQLDEHCLTIELKSAGKIQQQAVIASIQQGMKRLKPLQIQTVLVYGQAEGGANTWMESFMLDFFVPPTNSTKSPAVSQKTRNTSFAGSEMSLPPKPVPSPDSSTKRISLKVISLKANLISAHGWSSLLSGLILAIALFAIAPLKVLFRGFLVLVHEVGHAITHWAFGRPAIPTVNLYFGGGVTITFGQVWLVNVAIYLAIAYLIGRLRAYPRLQGAIGLATLVYTYCLFTRTNTMLSILMGHGMELIATAVCLFLATSGYFCRIIGDRTIYAMLGFFTFFSDMEFSWKLLHDAEFRNWYEGGIGGMMDNDFVILANEYFGVNLSTIAQIFLLACLLTPAIAF